MSTGAIVFEHGCGRAARRCAAALDLKRRPIYNHCARAHAYYPMPRGTWPTWDRGYLRHSLAGLCRQMYRGNPSLRSPKARRTWGYNCGRPILALNKDILGPESGCSPGRILLVPTNKSFYLNKIFLSFSNTKLQPDLTSTLTTDMTAKLLPDLTSRLTTDMLTTI